MGRYARLIVVGLLLSGVVYAGPYAPAAGEAGSTAVSKDSLTIAGWATGFLDYAPGPNVDATWLTPAKGLGPAVGDAFDIVGLGDSGRITLTFGGSIFNGPGADFAVFENSFSDSFLELAWVEVSSDGSSYFRFPGFSWTPNAVGAFGTIDPTDIDGLAGKYRQGFGTPFDLDTLAGVAGLDVNNVRFVRIVDIPGDGSVLDSYPSIPGIVEPHPIYDAFPTTGSGGFDLDAIGVMHLAPVPEPGVYVLMTLGLLLVFAVVRRRRPGDARMPALRQGGMGRRHAIAAGTLLGFAAAAHVGAATSTFDDLALAPESFFLPAAATTFASGAATFQHNFTNFGGGCCWDGWTYSNKTDTTTPGVSNQYSAYAGVGVASANYGIGFIGYAEQPTVTFATPVLVSEAYFTNTTYAALSMLSGDSFAKKFGGVSGNDADFLRLTITGHSPAGAVTDAVEFYLADYRFSNNAQDYVVKDWTFVDLSALGTVTKITFALDSSDVGLFGMNTPAYVAMDNLSVTAVPEPSAALLMFAGIAATVGAIRRRRRS